MAAKPYTLSGTPTERMVEDIDKMLDELYAFNERQGHNLLSATHLDSTAASVIKGDLIVGQQGLGAEGTVPGTKWRRLAIGTAGTVLRSDGADAAWSKVVLTSDVSGILPVANGGTSFATYTVGDLLYASAAGALSKLADVATGNALISGGVGAAPAYGKIGLTTHVSGILPVANGGTNFSSYTTGDLIAAASAGALFRINAVATGNALLSQGVGGIPQYGKIGLTTHVSGTLPVDNGGTGRASHTAYAVVCGGTTATGAQQSVASVGTSGQVLTSNGAGALPTFQTAASGGTPTEQTTTATGTQNNFDLSARFTYLRCNNASALVFSGFTVSGVAPQAGDIVIIENIGSSTVKVLHQDTGSTDVHRAICPSVAGQILGAGGRMECIYDGTTDRWREQVIDAGEPIAVPFDAANFTASGGGTWTLDAADQTTFVYTQRGVALTVNFFIQNTDVNAATSALQMLIPGGFVSSVPVLANCIALNAAVLEPAAALSVGAAGTLISVFRSAAGGNWTTTAADNTLVAGSITFQID